MARTILTGECPHISSTIIEPRGISSHVFHTGKHQDQGDPIFVDHRTLTHTFNSTTSLMESIIYLVMIDFVDHRELTHAPMTFLRDGRHRRRPGGVPSSSTIEGDLTRQNA